MYTAQGKINQQEVLQQYLPMVRRQALGLKTRLPSNIELDDLIQAGSIGLLDAMTRYDLNVGATFATFASQRIRGAMIDELRTRDWVPRSVRRNARAVEEAMHRVEQNLGRPAKEREVASAMGRRGLAPVLTPVNDFILRYRWQALLLLGLIATYRMSDTVMGVMANVLEEACGLLFSVDSSC